MLSDLPLNLIKSVINNDVAGRLRTYFQELAEILITLISIINSDFS